MVEALGAMRYIEDLLEKSNFGEMAHESARDIINSLLIKFGVLLTSVNLYYCRLIQALIPLLNADAITQQFDLHKKAEECVRICYPSNHPALGVHLRNIGIFARKYYFITKASS